MNALRRTLERRKFGYVVGLTLLVVFLGAAGMLNFEPAKEVQGGFTSYGDALWWTAMLLTSIGSQYWPVTTEGRVLGFLLALYSLGILGYLTAILASFFIGRDAHSSEGEVAGAREICELRNEIARLRETLLANDLGSAPVSRSASRRR
jgi:voltage-gated potassium channel